MLLSTHSLKNEICRIDKNGDSEGNFTAFALKDYNYTFVSKVLRVLGAYSTSLITFTYMREGLCPFDFSVISSSNIYLQQLSHLWMVKYDSSSFTNTTVTLYINK